MNEIILPYDKFYNFCLSNDQYYYVNTTFIVFNIQTSKLPTIHDAHSIIYFMSTTILT